MRYAIYVKGLGYWAGLNEYSSSIEAAMPMNGSRENVEKTAVDLAKGSKYLIETLPDGEGLLV